MLDQSALTQLKSLKKDIHDSTPRHEGIVRSTAGRFGFVVTDKHEQFYLSPDEMEKVLPSDRIAFRVENTAKGKQQAIIEKVVASNIKSFMGTYRVRGKGVFVEPDHPAFSRWVFVPPAKRLNAENGDLVRAHISKHPYPHGRVQATLDEVIGKPSERHIEQRFMLQKWNIDEHTPDDANEQVQTLLERHTLSDQRTDLTHLPFVTIDSAATRDIDDALYAEAQSQGWVVWIAIADPSALIEPGSALDTLAAKRATSAYLPDMVLPMLPRELSEGACSLQENETRPAMAVELHISNEGEIQQTNIHKALVKSHAKLSYSQVNDLIQGQDNAIAPALRGPVSHLHACSQALACFRKAHCLVMDERPDFKLITDDTGKAVDVIRLDRSDAHRLVEECMLACNRSVAHWLAERNSGFFIAHGGIRTERIGDVANLIKDALGLEKKPKIATLALNEYVELMQQAEQAQCEWPIKAILSRQQERSQYSLEPKPHSGLGFELYTTFTSPLRKYNDLLIHRLVKQCLEAPELPPQLPEQSLLDALNEQQTHARMAATQAESWLKLEWLSKQDPQQTYAATLLQPHSAGLLVRLDDNGMEGQIIFKKNKHGPTFDSKTMSLTYQDVVYKAGQALSVNVADIDISNRQLKLNLV